MDERNSVYLHRFLFVHAKFLFMEIRSKIADSRKVRNTAY